MSDDLVSRKDLLGTEQLLMTDIVKNNPTARYILERVLYDIENTPTAYDVDKVVEEIRKYADSIAELGGNFLPEIVIKIVKSGGVVNS